MPKKKKEEDKKESGSVDIDAIKEELTAYVDLELDRKLEKVVDNSIKKNIIDEIEKANKKVIHMKNRKIFAKNILLIIFFFIILFLLYLLYSNRYFDSYFSHSSNTNSSEKKVEEPVKKEEVIEITFDDLKEKYGSYIDPYVLSENSIYVDDFYQGKLTKELKNYYSFTQIDFEKLEIEDDYNVIPASSIKKICNSLFDSGCSLISFDYNGNKIRYFDKLNSYISNEIVSRNNSSIKREIIDIKENKNSVSIATIEGIVVDEQLYSVSPNEYIDEYYGDNLSNYSDSLNKVIYTFKNKKLVSVEKG